MSGSPGVESGVVWIASASYRIMSLSDDQDAARQTHQREWHPLPDCRRQTEEGDKHGGASSAARKTRGVWNQRKHHSSGDRLNPSEDQQGHYAESKTHKVPNIHEAKIRWDMAHKVARCILGRHHRFGGLACAGLDDDEESKTKGQTALVKSARNAANNCAREPKRAPSASISSRFPSNADGGSERL